MTKAEKIIVALDVETAAEAREIIAELRGEVGAFKIGLQLFTVSGASFVREIVADGIKLFLDVKFHDIPNTAAKASIEVARLGVWMFNVHAIGGGEMMRRTVESVREVCEKENLNQPKIIGVTVLTSSDQETLRETGVETEINTQVVNLARLAAKYNLDGVVASPHEINSIRQSVDKDNFLIVTPGIRSAKRKVQSAKPEGEDQKQKTKDQRPKTKDQFATNDDQKRVMTPGEAIAAGSDYLVIGRPITQSENKIAAVREILREIATA